MLGQNAPVSMQLGQLGSKFITPGSGTVNGNFGKIFCINTAEFSVLVSTTMATATGGDALDTLILPTGCELFGHFTSLAVSAGAIIAYNI